MRQPPKLHVHCFIIAGTNTARLIDRGVFTMAQRYVKTNHTCFYWVLLLYKGKNAHAKHLCRRTIWIAVENQHAHTFFSRHILPLMHRFSPRVRPFTIRLSWPHSSVIRLAFQDIFPSFYDNSLVIQKPLTAYFLYKGPESAMSVCKETKHDILSKEVV